MSQVTMPMNMPIFQGLLCRLTGDGLREYSAHENLSAGNPASEEAEKEGYG